MKTEKVLLFLSRNQSAAIVLQSILYDQVTVRYACTIEKGVSEARAFIGNSEIALVDYSFIKEDENFLCSFRSVWKGKLIIYVPEEEDRVGVQKVLQEGADGVLDFKIVEEDKIKMTLLNS